MSRVYISNDISDQIKDMFGNTPADDCSRNNCFGITDWTYKNFGVRFDGMSGGEGYYLEGPDELITWFLIRFSK